MIRFKCPACQKILKILDEGAGRKINCPKCGLMMQVPTPASLAQSAVLLPSGEVHPSAPVSSPVAPEVLAENGESAGQTLAGLITIRAGFLAASIALCCAVALCCLLAIQSPSTVPVTGGGNRGSPPASGEEAALRVGGKGAPLDAPGDREIVTSFRTASQYLSAIGLSGTSWFRGRRIAWLVQVRFASPRGVSLRKENGVGVARENTGFHARLNVYSNNFNVGGEFSAGDTLLLTGRLLRAVQGIGLDDGLFFIVGDWSLASLSAKDGPYAKDEHMPAEPASPAREKGKTAQLEKVSSSRRPTMATIPLGRGTPPADQAKPAGQQKGIRAGLIASTSGEDGFQLLLRHHGYREQYARILEDRAKVKITKDDGPEARSKKLKPYDDKIDALVKTIHTDRRGWHNRFFIFHGKVVKANAKKVLPKDGALEAEQHTHLVVAVQVKEDRKADLVDCTLSLPSSALHAGQEISVRGRAVKIANVDEMDPPYSWSNFQEAPLVVRFYKNSVSVVIDANPPHQVGR